MVKWVDDHDVLGFGLKFFEARDRYVILIEK